jgi:hypothetical protein
MKTPEQSVIELIKQLRANGVAYNTLMAERDKAEAEDFDDEDDDTVFRSTQSIDKAIDELLGDTMAITKQLVGISESPADEKPANDGYTVIGYYDDTGLRYVGHHSECESASAAIQRVADVYPDENICITAVLAGELKDLMGGDYMEDTNDWRKKTNGETASQPDRNDIRTADRHRVL